MKKDGMLGLELLGMLVLWISNMPTICFNYSQLVEQRGQKIKPGKETSKPSKVVDYSEILVQGESNT